MLAVTWESETSKYLFETKIKVEKIWHFTRIKPTEGFSLDHIPTVQLIWNTSVCIVRTPPYPPLPRQVEALNSNYTGVPQSYDYGLVNYFPIPSGMETWHKLQLMRFHSLQLLISCPQVGCEPCRTKAGNTKFMTWAREWICSQFVYFNEPFWNKRCTRDQSILSPLLDKSLSWINSAYCCNSQVWGPLVSLPVAKRETSKETQKDQKHQRKSAK